MDPRPRSAIVRLGPVVLVFVEAIVSFDMLRDALGTLHEQLVWGPSPQKPRSGSPT